MTCILHNPPSSLAALVGVPPTCGQGSCVSLSWALPSKWALYNFLWPVLVLLHGSYQMGPVETKMNMWMKNKHLQNKSCRGLFSLKGTNESNALCRLLKLIDHWPRDVKSGLQPDPTLRLWRRHCPDTAWRCHSTGHPTGLEFMTNCIHNDVTKQHNYKTYH
jgi:hypothetical protein